MPKQILLVEAGTVLMSQPQNEGPNLHKFSISLLMDGGAGAFTAPGAHRSPIRANNQLVVFGGASRPTRVTISPHNSPLQIQFGQISCPGLMSGRACGTLFLLSLKG